MYVKIEPHDPKKYGATGAARCVSYLTKEGEIAHKQLEKLEREADRSVSYLTKENTNAAEQLSKLEKTTSSAEIDKYRTMLNAPERLQGKDEQFFNLQSQRISAEEVIDKINSNKLGLKSNESHFYNLTVSPSVPELEHLESIAKWKAIDMGQVDNRELQEQIMRSLLKEHAVNVMTNYAQSFYRDNAVGVEDLVWYGKVEKDRYWKHDSAEVIHNNQLNKKIRSLEKKGGNEQEIATLREGLKRDGECVIYSNMPKSGLNHHVHIIVSRKDQSQRKSLSPLAKMKESANHKVNGRSCKAGFNRDNFIQSNETSFDQQFQYSRSFRTTYEARKARRKIEFCNKKIVEKQLARVELNNKIKTIVEEKLMLSETLLGLDNYSERIKTLSEQQAVYEKELKGVTLKEGVEDRLQQRQIRYNRLLEQYNESRGGRRNSFYSTIEGELMRAELAALRKEIQQLSNKVQQEAKAQGVDVDKIHDPELERLKKIYREKEAAFEQSRISYNSFKGYNLKNTRHVRLGKYALHTNSAGKNLSQRGAVMVANSAMAAVGLNLPVINLATQLIKAGRSKDLQKTAQFKSIGGVAKLVPGLKLMMQFKSLMSTNTEREL